MVLHTLRRLLAALAVCAGLGVLAAAPATADDVTPTSTNEEIFQPPYNLP